MKKLTDGKAVDLVIEKDQEFTITAQLPLTQGTTMFSRGCDLKNDYSED